MADRLRHALDQFMAAHPGLCRPHLVVAGGVAANRALRRVIEDEAARAGASLAAPPNHLCTDNAAMIAWAGAERLALGEQDGLDFSARARWPLDQVSAPVYGHGKLGAKA
jgi:N6-L-threonylcarbamoyladenine synthase